ncbi:hypothetical protein DZS_08660 [Dickeya ananatis]
MAEDLSAHNIPNSFTSLSLRMIAHVINFKNVVLFHRTLTDSPKKMNNKIIKNGTKYL